MQASYTTCVYNMHFNYLNVINYFRLKITYYNYTMYGGYVTCITHLQVKSYYNVNKSHLTKLPSSLILKLRLSRNVQQ